MNTPSYPQKWPRLFLGLMVLILASASLASAATYNFSGTSGLWSDLATWSPTGTPGASDSLTLSGSATGEIGLDTSRTITNFTSTKTGTLSFTDQATGTPSLNLTGNLLIQTNPGIIYFGSGTNLSVTGTTVVQGDSLLRIDGSSSFTGNIRLGSGTSGSGILGLGSGDLNINLGTGAGQLQIGGSDGGGFAAFNANRSVTFNSGASLTNLSLILGHSTATHTVTLTNSFTALSGATVLNGSAAVDAILTGNLSGSAGFVKEGAGTLELSGTNTYSTGLYGTRINGGVLRISGTSALSTSSRLVIAGGVLGLGAGDFNWALGGGGSQLAMLGNSIGSGFAAFGADRIVNIGGGTALSWASTTNFFTNANGGTADHLILNVAESDAKLTFQNAVNLNAATRKITVGDGSAAIDAAMTGVLSGTGASALRKQGAGTLELTNANTYAGGTTIAEGTLLANNTTGSATGSGTITLDAGATLGGTGSVAGMVITGGTTSTFSPGSNSVVSLSLLGGINATNGATFDLTLGTTSDLLDLGTALFTGSNSSGALQFNFTNGGGLLTGVDYTLLTFGSHIDLELADLIANSIPAGFAVDFFTINATNLQVRFTAIPEPGSLGLLIFAGALGMYFRKRSVRDVIR